MKIGKVEAQTLQETVFPYRGTEDSAVKIGPRIGGDGAVIAANNEGGYLAVAADPITGTSAAIGRFAVDINANDVACLGADPRWMTLTLLLPSGTEREKISRIMEEASDEAESLGVAIVSGHTELVQGLERPIVSGTMIGLSRILLDPEKVQEGDKLVMTGSAGLEGGAILADTFEKELRNKGIEDSTLRTARNFVRRLPIVEPARRARDKVSLMHDPTEGGLLGGIRELGLLTGKGIKLEEERVKVEPETKSICAALEVDPLRLIASGSLLLVVRPNRVPQLLEELSEFDPALIGTLSEEADLPESGPDELWRLMDSSGG